MTALTTDDVIAQLKDLVEHHTIQRGRCLDALKALRGDDAPTAAPLAAAPKPPAMPKLRPAKKSAAKKAQTSRTRGNPRGPRVVVDRDWPGIARCYLDAKATGQPTRDALASRFGEKPSTAQNWPA